MKEIEVFLLLECPYKKKMTNVLECPACRYFMDNRDESILCSFEE